MAEQSSCVCRTCVALERRLSDLQRESAAAHGALMAAVIECGIAQGVHSRVDVLRRLREEQGKLAAQTDRLAFDLIGDLARRLMSAY